MIKFKNISSIIALLFLVISFTACTNEKILPIYGQREAKITKGKDGIDRIDTVYQTIPAFKFLNQDSTYITQDMFKGKIYVADFFFTSCTTICPTMHRNLKTVFEQYKGNPDILFLSHTIDFKYDKPSVLKKYAQKLGVDVPQWQFVYGSKDEVYTLAEKSYLTVVKEDSTATDGYIHQGWLVLIDKEKRMRGAYDGTKTEEVDKLKKDIAILLAEEKK
ncbi:SCO family protein [Pedobacter sp. LMG 31464]|uniref:SCO family protein n=1 Tax=Pedobacter planticolens TaxID=2679964 RepID=A0A923IWE4_9SPHI|nr:SCO family protein [Pedobacter planticolens]MBB2145092.1 SCO family protein [Pedobacter planticolens]